MIDVNKAVIARVKRGGHTFEILVDCEKAVEVRQGNEVALHELVAAQQIYNDAKRGLVAAQNELEAIFNSTDVGVIAIEIIKKGELQLTQEYREKLRTQKRSQIIGLLHRNGVDPKTHAPHPPQRIENALVEAKFHVDEFKDVNVQVSDALNKIRNVLPIKFEIKEMEIKISPQYAPKCYAPLRNFGNLIKEEWLSSGYWLAVLEIPGGMEYDFVDTLNKLTHGNMEYKTLKVK